MKTYLRILGYASPFSRFALPYALLTILAVFFGLVNYSFLMPTFDVLFKSGMSQVTSLASENSYKQWMDKYVYAEMEEHGKEYVLLIICFLLIASNLLANIFKYFSLRAINKTRSVVIKNLREDIFQRINRLHVGFFSNERKGDIISRLTNDVQEVENSVVNTLTVVFRDPIQIIFYFTVLFWASWKLTLITLVLLPISGIMISMVSKRLKKPSEQSQISLGVILSNIEEMLSGIKLIKAFNAQNYIFKKFDKENSHYAGVMKKYTNRRELASPLSEFLGVCVVAVILWVGGNMVFQGEMEGGQFVGFIISFYKILESAKGLTSAFSGIQRGLASARRIFAITDTPPAVTDAPEAFSLQSFDHSLEFKNVGFTYTGEKDVLKNISFKLPKGKTLALVGPSGGGKSTLVDLVPRFYDVASGEILLDGKNIKAFTQESLREQMGIVTQESILFNDTIYNNIVFGNTHATEAQVIEAAKTANAHEFILQTPEGYQSNIGDRGSKLSGGQRQRICIARAILRNPPILILDEATSALDAESEKLVQEALTKLMEHRTTLVIAHRLSTIQHADEILVIQKGEIVERGTHSQLLAQNGVYYKLHGHIMED